jgi:hypothetical protein
MDLLEACNHALKYLRSLGLDGISLGEELEAAIAKAEGGAK